MLLDWFHRKVLPSRTTLKGLAIVIAGIFLLSDPSNWNVGVEGIIWGALSSIGFGIYFYSSQSALKEMSIASATFCTCFGCFLIFAVLSLHHGTQLPDTWEEIGNISGITILATLLPIYFVFLALRHIDGAKVSVLSILEPIVTIILGVAFLNEKLMAMQSIGILIVLLGAYVLQSGKRVG